MADGESAAVSLHRITKSFSGVPVLRDVSLELQAGRVHGLVGMNGSGKSTLIKVLAGIYRPEAGQISFGNQSHDGAAHISKVTLRRQRADVSIGFVHQDLGVIDSLSIAENFAMSLGYTTTRFGWVRQQSLDDVTTQALLRVGVDVPHTTQIGDLGSADRTLTAIARALTALQGQGKPCLVMDEPTAALPREEVDRVLGVVAQLAAEGAAILFVTHNLKEILSVSQDLTVLRDGRVVHSGLTSGVSEQAIVDLMLGQRVEGELADRLGQRSTAITTGKPAKPPSSNPFNHESAPQSEDTADAQARAELGRDPEPTVNPPVSPPVLSLDNVSGTRVRGVNLVVNRGEVVVITGLVGCGKSEIGRMIARSTPVLTGNISLNGQRHDRRSPRGAVRAGVSYVPAERLLRGGILGFAARENITLAALDQFARRGIVRVKQERRVAEKMMATVNVAPMAPEQPFAAFSGGNQQKIVLGRALLSEPALLVIDEPTQGVDVGAIPTIYGEIRNAARAGAAVLVITSSYEEAVTLGDRALFLDRGHLTSELGPGDLSVSRLAAVGTQRNTPLLQARSDTQKETMINGRHHY